MSYIGELVQVYAPATGIVYWGFKIPGAAEEEIEFGSDDVIGFVKTEDGEEWDIRPNRLGDAKGVVHEILYESGSKVNITQFIAIMRVTSIPA